MRWWWRVLPPGFRRWLEARFGDLEPTVERGYWVWAVVGVLIAVPEIWAAAGKPPWPTISGTIGHLEARWNIVAVVVVAALVLIAAHAVRLPFTGHHPVARQADGRSLGRTAGGRFTVRPGQDGELRPFVYLAPAVAAVVVGSILARSLSDNKWILGYVIYGLLAVFCVIIPSVLANLPMPDAPFAGVFPTLADLQRRLHFVGMIILAGLVVLLIHLALYPWPDVFRHAPAPDSP